MPWLVRDGHVLASLVIATSHRDRRTGLLGQDGFEGALLLRPCRSVHTLGMKFAIDVAHLDDELTVLHATTMKPWRVGGWHRKAHAVLEAEAGAFASWDLHVGDALEVRE
ncbi:MAG: DUF192 domain-containing protein [Actinomycetota bacterium]|nr:DUF192 domain-containing protein [Acidimicrobiia bacterium]MDQ3294423.1 DUF192 domain-containing protein [Actinomycetota bacterium]